MKASYLDDLAKVTAEAVQPAAVQVDRQGQFPRAAIQALADAGLLGLVSAAEVGGRGQGLRAAAEVVERLARRLRLHRHGGVHALRRPRPCWRHTGRRRCARRSPRDGT